MKDLHRDALELAAASIDFELTSAERAALARHLADCPACRQRVEAMGRDAVVIADLPRLPVSPATSSRLWAGIRRRPTALSTMRLVAVAAILALLALTALSVGATLLRDRLAPDLAVVPTETALLSPTVAPSAQPAPASPTLPPVQPSPTVAASPDSSPPPVVVDETWRPISADPYLPAAGSGSEALVPVVSAAVSSPSIGRVVAVGCLAAPQELGEPLCSTAVAWASTDGLTWGPAAALPVDEAAEFATADHIIALADRLVAGGRVRVGDRWTATTWSSPDGVSWSSASGGEAFADAAVRGLATLDARVVAVGGHPEGGGAEAWFSDGGREWTAAAFDAAEPDGLVDGVTGIPGEGFLAWGSAPEGDGGRWWQSADGSSWTARQAPAGLEAAGVRAIEVAGSEVIAVGTAIDADGFRPAAWTRPASGGNWSESDAWGAEQVADVAAVGEGAVAVSSDEAGQAHVWSRPSAGAWGSVMTQPGLTPVALAPVPGAAGRVLLFARDETGSTLVWAGGVGWTP